METKRNNSTRNLLLWCAPIVMGHFLVVLWHLWLLVKVQPSTHRFLPPLLILVNLLPVAGLVAFAKGFRRLAGSMITIPLGVALAAGVYAHFLRPGADNVFRMSPGDLTLSFQVSAMLLVLLEALGCWIGIRVFVTAHVRQALRT